MNIGILGHSVAAIAFFAFSLLLLSVWRGRAEGAFLVSATLLTCLWAVAAIFYQSQGSRASELIYLTFEVARNVGWFVFLFHLLGNLRQAAGDRKRFHLASMLVYILSFILLLLDGFTGLAPVDAVWSGTTLMQLAGHLGLAITGLALIEQLFRNTRPEKRWAVKYLYFGIGLLFVYDFYFYADALLFNRVDASLWEARGFVNVIVVPMVAVAAARNPSWSVYIFVSRRVVFHTTTFLGAGIYLLVMSGAGYYIRYYGGSWGQSAQIVFLFFTLVFLVAILFSSTIRSRMKVFLSKHFFNYKYDYRDEWLRIIKTLSSGEADSQIQERVIKAVVDLVDSSGGVLWMLDESGKYLSISHWHAPNYDISVLRGSSLIRFLKAKDWIIDFQELRESPGLYDELELQKELDEIDSAWLLVPIKYQTRLIGFFVLLEPRAPRQINWEDRDLLKTAAQQAGSYLALMKASEALSRANQFEAFNRLSAFVVHDLKNLLAQLELVVKNSERHKHNPEFMDDAIKTVDDAANKMGRLLNQLRKGRFEANNARLFSVSQALQQAIDLHLGSKPKPQLLVETDGLDLVADKDRFTAVIGHMVKNAQEATPEHGFVEVKLTKDADFILITIEDNGVGMEPKFIRSKLFQPFETTKGNAGMGIGVYESREFVRSLGGDIEVTSKIDAGTIFILKLPAKKHSVEAYLDGTMQSAGAVL